MNKMEKTQKILDQAASLHDRFSTDVKSRLETIEINYAFGLTKFITKYFEIVEKTEPTVSATTKLTFLHTVHR